MRKAALKNVPHRPMTIVRRPGATTWTRQLGAATMIARCEAPSSARAARKSGTGGSRVSNADSAAAAASPRTRLRRKPIRSTTSPAEAPKTTPTTPTVDSSQPASVGEAP